MARVLSVVLVAIVVALGVFAWQWPAFQFPVVVALGLSTIAYGTTRRDL